VQLRDEAALLEPVFARAGEPFVLVGHSYGAAVALIAALAGPRRVRALVLYEPTLFSLLDAASPPPNEADGIRATAACAMAALDAGDAAGAAQCFIDYWMAPGAWARLPESRKATIAETIVSIRGWAGALFGEPTPLAAFAALRVPTLFMMGKVSPASSRGVARLLTRTLPEVEIMEFEGLGHMGPVTHPDVVNAAISRYLCRLDGHG
jgi:pimeloyl-ACP methyl ester carboxylesterase